MSVCIKHIGTLVWYLQLFITTYVVLCDQNNYGKFTRVECTTSETFFVQNTTCRAKLINRNLTLITMEGYIVKELNDVTLEVRLYKRASNIYRAFLVHVKEKVCGNFGKRWTSPYTNIVFDMIKQYSNIAHACPFMGPIYVKQCPFNPNLLPSVWPAGKYRLDLNFTESNIFVGVIQIFYDLNEKILV